MSLRHTFTRILPGLLLCSGITASAYLLHHMARLLTAQTYLEPLVLAILIGAGVRTLWTPGSRWLPGIHFAAKSLLEIAVVLLGASVGADTLMAMGPTVLLGIVIVVALALLASYGISRLLGMSSRMALLVACGNSICGNSAIAAVAPVIDADADEVAIAVAFTAVFGVAVVLGLPLLVPIFKLSVTQYGFLAGMTVYAVPQVLAATLPIGALANQTGTLVKLVRVLLLGPIVLAVSIAWRKRSQSMVGRPQAAAGSRPGSDPDARINVIVPWFIVGFLLLAGLRTAGLIPGRVLAPTVSVANTLTSVSMAALGLGVDVRAVARAGVRVSLAVALSLLLLGIFSLILILELPS